MRVSTTGRLLVAWSALLVAVIIPRTPHLLHDIGGPSFPAALVALGSLVAAAIAAWVLLVAGLVSAGASSRLVRRLTPALLRRALLAGTAGVLAIAPAHADERSAPALGPQHSVSGLPLPDRPEGRAVAAPTSPARPPTAAPPQGVVEVRPGDTLWGIAARSLPRGTDDARIAAATRAWHDANRAVIGDDPDLLFPAQRLVPPTGKDQP